MKVLLVIDGGSYWAQNMYKGLCSINSEHEFHLYDKNINNFYYAKEGLKKIYTNNSFKILLKVPLLRKIIRPIKWSYDFNKIHDYYDIVHIISWTHDTDIFVENKHKICKKLLVSITGADFLDRQREPFDSIRKNLFVNIDGFTIAHQSMKNDFYNYYGISKDIVWVNKMGLSLLDFIDRIEGKDRNKIRDEWSLPRDKLLITIGTNGVFWQRHDKIIKSITKISPKYMDKLFFIFPITYNRTEDHIAKFKTLVNKFGLKHIYLENFLPEEKLAELRIVSDVLIQVQDHDAFSGAMQEHMYAGSVVITGKWLPYQILDKQGAYLHKISELSELPNALKVVMDNIELEKRKAQRNKQIIYNLSSSKKTSEAWIETYNKLLNK